MGDREETLLESKRLTTNSRQLLKEFEKLLRQSHKIIQEGRDAVLKK